MALSRVAFACLLLASGAYIGAYAQDPAAAPTDPAAAPVEAPAAETPTADYPSVLEAATANNLTTLLAVAQGTVLLPSLESTTFQGIVLAPTDAAFTKLNESLGGVLGELPPELIAQVLQYHVIAGNETFPMLDNATRSVVDTLLSGQVSAEEATGALALIPTGNATVPGQLYAGGVAPGTLIDPAKSVTAGQARVYIIDDVLFPPFSNLMNQSYPLSVAALANTTGNFSTLLTLVAGDSEVLELLSNPATAYTIFAPNDEAFTSLLTTLNLDVAQLLPLVGSDTAKRVLKHHILQAPPTFSDGIADGAELVLPSLSAEAADTITIKNSGGTITVAGTGNTEAATVVDPDYMAGLSVVHVIDKVLLPAGLELGATPAPAAEPAPAAAPATEPALAPAPAP